MAQGGYRTPPPGGVPAPGALSQRTDHQPMATLPDAQYGEERTFHDQQAAAPLAAAAPVPGGGGGGGAGGALATIDGPSQRPGEPVTAGVPIGPGPGPEALTQSYATPRASYGSLADVLSGLSASDSTGSMAALLRKALDLGLGQ